MDQTSPTEHAGAVGLTGRGWPPCDSKTVYDYCFCVWPDAASRRWNRSVFALFEAMKFRIVLEFTERGFNDFREELSKVGLALCEIERSPHLEPVPVP